MSTMSAARIRSLYRRRNHAHEAVYHFSANPVQPVVTGFSPTRASGTQPSPSADERFRAALSARDGESGPHLIRFRATSQFNFNGRRPTPCRRFC